MRVALAPLSSKRLAPGRLDVHDVFAVSRAPPAGAGAAGEQRERESRDARGGATSCTPRPRRRVAPVLGSRVATMVPQCSLPITRTGSLVSTANFLTQYGWPSTVTLRKSRGAPASVAGHAPLKAALSNSLFLVFPSAQS